MIPADSRKELEDRLDECIETLVANRDALIELNAGDTSGFKEVLNTLDEELEHLVDTISEAREAMDEDS